MLQINDNYISVGIYDILLHLRGTLNSMGIDLLRDIKDGDDNVMVTCPNHKDGQERKPSCGIRKFDREGAKEGTVHCFTCGYACSFQEFVSNCFGYDDKGEFGSKWLLETFYSIGIENRQDYLDFSDNESNNKINYISEEELAKYRFYHPYMYQRKLTDDIINKYDIGYDPENGGSITFPVCDEFGRCLFIGRRMINYHYFNYPKNVDKPLYGLHLVPDDCNDLIVCESVFNALTCVRYGKNAIALLGTGTKNQYDMLSKLKCRHLILGLDPDEAGLKGSIRLLKSVKNKYITRYNNLPVGKDINDLNEDEFNSLQEEFADIVELENNLDLLKKS